MEASKMNDAQEKEKLSRALTVQRRAALYKGLAILAAVIVINIIGGFFWGVGGILISLVIFALILFLVLYFVWAPQDILGTFIDEGYCKVIILGSGKGKFHRIIMNYKGKMLDNDWNVKEGATPQIKKASSILGMHFIWPWFFSQIYTHFLEWRKYDPIKKVPATRKEILRQTSLMPYPYFIEVVQAEDKERAPLNLSTVVTMKIVNPYKALFNVTTEWVYVVSAKIEGAYVAYIKQHTFNQMIQDPKSLGSEIVTDMKEIFEGINEDYGIEIVSLDVINISGGDIEVDAAIRAEALAKLQKKATIVNAEAQAEKIKIIADAEARRRAAAAQAFMSMLTSRTGLNPEDITDMQANEPEVFQHLYGDIVRQCNDSVAQMISAESGSLLHIMSAPGSGQNGSAGGLNTDLIATVTAMLKAMNMPAVTAEQKFPTQASEGQSQSTSNSKKQPTSPKDDAAKKIVNNPNSVFHGKTQAEMDIIFGKKKKKQKNSEEDELTDEELEVLREKGLRD